MPVYCGARTFCEEESALHAAAVRSGLFGADAPRVVSLDPCPYGESCNISGVSTLSCRALIRGPQQSILLDS